ncbi:acetyltransferase [Seiridium cupressi]
MADWLLLVPETHDSPGTPASSRPSNALVTDKKRSEAFNKARARGELNHSHDVSPIGWNGLAIHPHYQGRGVATLVVRWEISKAIKKGVPVFVTGEFAGVEFYKKIGFRALEGTEFWLVKDGRELSSNQVNQGTTTWSAAEGGVSGAQLIWEPHQPIP